MRWPSPSASPLRWPVRRQQVSLRSAEEAPPPCSPLPRLDEQGQFWGAGERGKRPARPNNGGPEKTKTRATLLSYPTLAPQNWGGRAILMIAVLLCLFTPSRADTRRQVLVVVADHLTLSDTLRPGLPSFKRLRERGQMALMSPGLAQGPTPLLNVYATLGAGDAVRVGDKSQGLLGRTLAQRNVRTALIGNADSDETGSDNPASLILPAPTDSSPNDGARPDPLAPGGRRTDPARLWQATQAALAAHDFVVVHDGDFARTEHTKDSLLPAVYAQHRARALHSLDAYLGSALAYVDIHANATLLLAVPSAPFVGGTWDSLTPFFCYTHALPPSPVMQSATTQTWGLAAARDFAPIVLALLHVPAPIQMTGAPIEAAARVPPNAVLPRLRRLDTETRLNQDAQNPFFWTVGLLGGTIVLTGLGLAFGRTGGLTPALCRAARYAVRGLSALPLALLLAPLAPAHTLPALYAAITALILLLALLPSPAVILSMTALALVGDGITGTALVSQSLLSVYALSGIRFYGIGNEYMGVMLAGTLTLAGSAFFAKRGQWPMTLLFGLVIVVLSFPSFGAKAGGAVTATATFWVAWRLLNHRPVGARHVLMGLAAGFALVLLWGVLGHWLPMRRTHIDTATAALGHARFGYIVGVALRKLGLAVHVALHPGTLAGLLGLAAAGLLARRVPASRFADYHAHHPRFLALWRAAVWGCLVCVVFNDSGIVAAILLLTSLAVVGLHGLLDEYVPGVDTDSTGDVPRIEKRV